MTIPLSHFVGGLDAAREIERQISLTLNNLCHILIQSDVGQHGVWGDDGTVRLTIPDGSYWLIKDQNDARQISTVSFYCNYKEGKEPLEWLKFTLEKNYLWMRSHNRPQVVQVCHSALQGLLDETCKWFPKITEELTLFSELHVYALNCQKAS